MPFRRPGSLRAALALGFAVTFGLWLFVGLYLTRRIAEVGRASETLNTRYTEAQELLSTMRAQVLLGSVYLRDGLLDPNATTITEYRGRIAEAYRLADDALNRYRPLMDTPEDRARAAELRRELDEFHATVAPILLMDRREWATDARALLQKVVVPKREGVIRLSEDVQSLNRRAFIQQQTRVAAFYVAAERQIWISLGVALLISLGIAFSATMYAGRLEDRLNDQREREHQYARDLQRLSAKIVGVQEEERRTLARELHDDIGQVLTAIKVELALAQRHIEAGGGPPNTLDKARDISDRALRTVRDLSHLLHPAVLDDLGLPAALDSYLQDFGKRHGIRVELLQDGTVERLQPATEAAAYRIVQEALTNVANHANAIACRVQLQRLPTTLLVSVDDDGRGFDPSVASTDNRGGLGLLSIRERVTQLLGTLRLESAPGKGTRLTVVLPAVPRQPDGEVSARG